VRHFFTADKYAHQEGGIMEKDKHNLLDGNETILPRRDLYYTHRVEQEKRTIQML
jgi:hypothetical protein